MFKVQVSTFQRINPSTVAKQHLNAALLLGLREVGKRRVM